MNTLNARSKKVWSLPKWILVLALIFVLPGAASAHCDSYDGPVIQDAVKAIQAGEVDPVLKWVEKEYEDEIVSLFNKTIALKDQDQEIYGIVEKHFLETLVRLHREGEGAPYTGLKPAGSTSQIVTWSDEALKEGEVDALAEKIAGHLKSEIKSKFAVALESRQEKDETVKSGREYVEAYVQYTHYLEAVHDAIAGVGGHGH